MISPQLIKNIIKREIMTPENIPDINSGNFKPILSKLNDKYIHNVMNAIIDTLKSAGISIGDEDIPEGLKFVNEIIGKTGTFTGLKYGENNEYIGHKCVIIDVDDDTDFGPNATKIKNFNSCYWNIKFPEFKMVNILYGVPGVAIKLD